MTVLHPSILIANILTSIVQVFQTKKFSPRPCLLCLLIRTSQERLKSPLKSTCKRNYLFPVNNTCFPIRKESLIDMRLLVLQTYVWVTSHKNFTSHLSFLEFRNCKKWHIWLCYCHSLSVQLWISAILIENVDYYLMLHFLPKKQRHHSKCLKTIWELIWISSDNSCALWIV